MNKHRDSSDDRFAGMNLTSVSFPSDSISIESLRRLFPNDFDVEITEGMKAQPKFFLLPENSVNASNTLGNVLYCERLLAAWYYAKEKGIAPPETGLVDIQEELSESYCKLGIAIGTHHAEELMRDIERQVKKLINDKTP